MLSGKVRADIERSAQNQYVAEKPPTQHLAGLGCKGEGWRGRSYIDVRRQEDDALCPSGTRGCREEAPGEELWSHEANFCVIRHQLLGCHQYSFYEPFSCNSSVGYASVWGLQ